MRNSKCCVPGCNSSRENVALHKFPKGQERLKHWVNSINCDFFRGLSEAELQRLQVCHKHFEKRFVTEKSRILTTAYPRLFSDEEISTGIPTSNYMDDVSSINLESEHNYFRKSHFDHTYSTLMKSSSSSLSALHKRIKTGELIERDTEPLPPTAADEEVPEATSPDRAECPVDDDAVMVSDDEVEETLYENPVGALATGKASEAAANEDSGAGKLDMFTAHHTGYRCDVCLEDIIGLRYACIECTNFDLCGACDARGEHSAHYVLRVPANKLHLEVQAVLENMRNILLERAAQNSSQPAVKLEEEQEVKLEEEPQIDAEDPLFTFLDCHRDVSQEQTHTREELVLTPTADDRTQSYLKDAPMYTFLTEPVIKPCDLLRTAQVNEESEKASYIQVNTRQGRKRNSRAAYSLLKTNNVVEESQEVPYRQVSKENLISPYVSLRVRRTEETQKAPVRLRMGRSGGQIQEASGSRVVVEYTES